MKESSKGQIKDLWVREDRRDFGPDGIGDDLQWFLDNWRIVRGLRTGSIKLALHSCQIYAADLIPKHEIGGFYGKPYEVIDDAEPIGFKISDIKLISFLKRGESFAAGTVMRERAPGLKGDLSLSDAKRMLDHQDEIPVEWRGKNIMFTKTTLIDSFGILVVAYLSWRIDRWCLGFSRIENDMNLADAYLPHHK